jgi:hypothetical protein
MIYILLFLLVLDLQSKEHTAPLLVHKTHVAEDGTTPTSSTFKKWVCSHPYVAVLTGSGVIASLRYVYLYLHKQSTAPNSSQELSSDPSDQAPPSVLPRATSLPSPLLLSLTATPPGSPKVPAGNFVDNTLFSRTPTPVLSRSQSPASLHPEPENKESAEWWKKLCPRCEGKPPLWVSIPAEDCPIDKNIVLEGSTKKKSQYYAHWKSGEIGFIYYLPNNYTGFTDDALGDLGSAFQDYYRKNSTMGRSIIDQASCYTTFYLANADGSIFCKVFNGQVCDWISKA